MRNLSICFVLPKILIAPNGAIVGGSTNSAIGLALTLIRNGVEVDIVAPLSNGEERALQKHAIYPYMHRIPLSVSSRKIGAIYRLFRLRRAVAHAIRSRAYDIVHIHSGSILYGNIFTGLMSSILRIHSVYCPIISKKKRHGISFIRIILANLVATQIDYYIGVTSSIYNSIQRTLFNKKKSLNIPMSIDVSGFKRLIGPQKEPDRIIFSKNIRLLFVGNASKEKGLEVLIEALIILDQQKLNFELVAAIENRSNMRIFERRRHMIQRMIKANGLESYVRMIDEVENVAELIGQVDVIVIPFQNIIEVERVSGYPMILLEAMACGKCVVTTPLEGVREVVNHDQNGILSTSFSAESISRAIQYAAVSPEKRAMMGDAARQTIHQNYSTDIIANKLKNIYSEWILQKNG